MFIRPPIAMPCAFGFGACGEVPNLKFGSPMVFIPGFTALVGGVGANRFRKPNPGMYVPGAVGCIGGRSEPLNISPKRGDTPGCIGLPKLGPIRLSMRPT